MTEADPVAAAELCNAMATAKPSCFPGSMAWELTRRSIGWLPISRASPRRSAKIWCGAPARASACWATPPAQTSAWRLRTCLRSAALSHSRRYEVGLVLKLHCLCVQVLHSHASFIFAFEAQRLLGSGVLFDCPLEGHLQCDPASTTPGTARSHFSFCHTEVGNMALTGASLSRQSKQAERLATSSTSKGF